MSLVESKNRLPWEGQPYSVKRYGVTIDNCDTEPVQTPGCIQEHGVLFVLRSSDLTILQVSENVNQFFNVDVADLLNQPVSRAVGDEPRARFLEALANETLEHNPLHVCTLHTHKQNHCLDVVIHVVDGLVVVECEKHEEREPSDVLDRMRLVKNSITRLQRAETLDDFCAVACEELRALTQLDRMMIYKFHSDNHGEVIAESRRSDLPSWVGLHYPAEDIPEPAREVFRRIWVRSVVDVHASVAELVPLVNPERNQPLTMTYCGLRAPSVMYTEYLKNMKVRSSLTMPIRRGDKLWGLIAGHHYSAPAFVPYHIRAACEHLAQVVSLQHRAIMEREQFLDHLRLAEVHQHLVTQAARGGGLHMLALGTPNLLEAMESTGAALFHLGRWWCVGRTPAMEELDALGDWLLQRFTQASISQNLHSSYYVTNALSRDYPPAAAFKDRASGLLALTLSRHGKHLITWFRPETIQTLKWGGNPHDRPMIPGPHGFRLTPRKSFETFVESVSEQSVPWRDVEINAALQLRETILEFVVERAEQLTKLNEELSRSNEELDAFAYVASHDLKEPLRGIHKYACQLEEDQQLSKEERSKKLEGLMHLAVRMDNLLDSLLQFSRVGRVIMQLEAVDLGEVVNEALEMIMMVQQDRPTEIIIPRPLPIAYVDRVRVREVFANLISNALKYNDAPSRKVEIGYLLPKERRDDIHAPMEVAQQIIYYVRDNGIGIQAKHFEQIFKIFRRLHPRDKFGGGAGAGLTIAKKVIERHHGRIWLTSTPKVGTTFYFTFGEEAP